MLGLLKPWNLFEYSKQLIFAVLVLDFPNFIHNFAVFQWTLLCTYGWPDEPLQLIYTSAKQSRWCADVLAPFFNISWETHLNLSVLTSSLNAKLTPLKFSWFDDWYSWSVFHTTQSSFKICTNVLTNCFLKFAFSNYNVPRFFSFPIRL